MKMNKFPSPESFNDTTPERIIGTENEYSIGKPQNCSISEQDLLEDLGVQCVSHNGSSRDDIFTSFGARIYDDMGLTEVATAESLGPYQAALTDHAGAMTISQMTHQLRAFYQMAGVDLSKDNQYPLRRAATFHSHPNENKRIRTRGYHQNLQFPASLATKNWKVFAAVTSSFLAAKPLISGAGFSADHYSVSQKMHGVGASVAPKSRIDPTSHGCKPLGAAIYNISDIFEKSTKDWGILEVRSSEPSMNPRITYLDLASTSLCLRLLERRYITEQNFENYAFHDPVNVAKSMRAPINETLSSVHTSLEGSELRAPIMLGRFATAIQEMAANEDLPEDEQKAAEEWCAISEKVAALDPQNPDIDSLQPDVEWAAKYQFIESHSRKNRSDDLFRRATLDMLWTNIGEKNTFGKDYFLRHDPSYTRSIVEGYAYTENSPKHTRAHARAALVNHPACTSVDWSEAELRASDDTLKRIDMPDAYNPNLS